MVDIWFDKDTNTIWYYGEPHTKEEIEDGKDLPLQKEILKLRGLLK